LRNNIFIGQDDNRPSLQATTFTHYSFFDYNRYRKKNNNLTNYRLRYPTIDSLNQANEKEIPMAAFKTLEELRSATGFEQHGMELDINIFEQVTLPDSKNKGKIYPLKGYDFRLKAGAKAVDAGCVLPNLTDGYIGKAPDLGAMEYGQLMVKYGPRK